MRREENEKRKRVLKKEKADTFLSALLVIYKKFILSLKVKNCAFSSRA